MGAQVNFSLSIFAKYWGCMEQRTKTPKEKASRSSMLMKVRNIGEIICLNRELILKLQLAGFYCSGELKVTQREESRRGCTKNLQSEKSHCK